MASLDTDGRVIELCSFSKVRAHHSQAYSELSLTSSSLQMVAPGSRLGWILAPSLLISKLSQRNEVTMQSVSGFSVAAMCAFLGAFGGQVGWERYLEGVADGVSLKRPDASLFFSFDVRSDASRNSVSFDFCSTRSELKRCIGSSRNISLPSLCDTISLKVYKSLLSPLASSLRLPPLDRVLLSR